MKFKNSLFRIRKQLAVLVALFAVVSTATAAQAPELRRRYDNSTRIKLMHPYMQPKVGAILADMESHGQYPVIDGAVYRSAKQQAALKGKGFSTVGYSFHMVTDRDAKGKAVPASMAADIRDFYKGYNVPNAFWMLLASSAQHHDLTTGIYWGLSPKDRQHIRDQVNARNWNAKIKRGWDPAHTEPRPAVLTLGQAKRGKRPPVRVATR